MVFHTALQWQQRHITLRWCHNGRYGVSNHKRFDCLRNLIFRRRWKKISKPRVTGLYEGNSSVIDEFPSQRASNVYNVSIWWRHHEIRLRACKRHSVHRLPREAMGCLLCEEKTPRYNCTAPNKRMDVFIVQVSGLPPRVLHEGDVPPHIPDMTPQVNELLATLNKMYALNTATDGKSLVIWRRLNCSYRARYWGRQFLENIGDHMMKTLQALGGLIWDLIFVSCDQSCVI